MDAGAGGKGAAFAFALAGVPALAVVLLDFTGFLGLRADAAALALGAFLVALGLVFAVLGCQRGIDLF